MNYRQWKKNYKKKHGVNPPIQLDKRKQAKVMRNVLRKMNKTDWQQKLNYTALQMGLAIKNAIKAMGEAFIRFGEAIRDIKWS